MGEGTEWETIRPYRQSLSMEFIEINGIGKERENDREKER